MTYGKQKTAYEGDSIPGDVSPAGVLDLELVHTSLVTGTRSPETLKLDRVEYIVGQGFDPEKAVALIAYWDGRKFRILDGNHRLEAAKRSGVEWIPIIQLNAAQRRELSARGGNAFFLVRKVDDPLRWSPANRPPKPI